MENRRIKIGITQGDINGIGYEVILKTLADNRLTEFCTPIVYGSPKVAAYHRKVLDLPQIPMHQASSAGDARADQVNIIGCTDDEVQVQLGLASEEAGKAAFQSLESAVADLKNEKIDVLVTAPINKNTIQSEVFRFPGHTEYLEKSAGEDAKSLMILLKDELRVALVTGHIPLTEVPATITTERIIEKLRLFNRSLKEDFGIIRPRIAVLSLNPHAGDDGLIGQEEQSIIVPAIKQAESKGALIFGPYPADGFFGSGAFESFDGVLAMYHDQGLAPFKTLAMDEGVNFTAGLPFVRTSPAHGSAYDIAGQNKASEASFRSAVYAAIDIYRNRKAYKEANANPLKKQFHDRGNDNEKLDLS